MPRSPEEWDAWMSGASAPPPGGAAADAALENALSAIPGRRHKTVGDLGCGEGRLVPMLAARFARVIAVDFAPATLARAREACEGLARPVVFRRRDLRDLTPLRGRLDVALLVHAVHGPRASDADRVLSEAARSLAPGGVMVGLFRARPRRGGPAVPMPLGDEPLAGSPDGLPAFHETELQYRLRRAGFGGFVLRRVRGTGGAPDALLAVAAHHPNN
jgi:SAM-dependent methyltransferase